MKSRHFVRTTLTLVVLIFILGCNHNRYVVLSPNVVMNTKDGMAYPVDLDSTFHVYDHIRIKGDEVVLVSRFNSEKD